MKGTKEGVGRLREKSIGTGHDARTRTVILGTGSEGVGYDAAVLLENRGLPP
jgi:hypothetical protein